MPRYSENRDEDMRMSRGNRGNFRERDEEGRFSSQGGRSSRYEEDDDYDRSSSRRNASSGGRSTRSQNQGQGWFGDEEGHREAAMRGWEQGHRGQRSRSDEDDDYDNNMRRSSRSRYDRDDEDRSYASASRRGSSSRSGNQSQGHGGWFGDEEGHREAAMRGWEHGHRGQRRSSGNH